MGVSYYDALLPVREPGDDLVDRAVPHWVLASVSVPGGQVVLAFVSDSALLSRMFGANWAQPAADREPDATRYALARPCLRLRA